MFDFWTSKSKAGIDTSVNALWFCSEDLYLHDLNCKFQFECNTVFVSQVFDLTFPHATTTKKHVHPSLQAAYKSIVVYSPTSAIGLKSKNDWTKLQRRRRRWGSRFWHGRTTQWANAGQKSRSPKWQSSQARVIWFHGDTQKKTQLESAKF